MTNYKAAQKDAKRLHAREATFAPEGAGTLLDHAHYECISRDW